MRRDCRDRFRARKLQNMARAILVVGNGGMMFGHDGSWTHFWGGGMLMWLIVIVVIAVAVYFVVQSTRRHDSTLDRGSQSESAQEILKKRYAKGEISKEEYEQMKRDIS